MVDIDGLDASPSVAVSFDSRAPRRAVCPELPLTNNLPSRLLADLAPLADPPDAAKYDGTASARARSPGVREAAHPVNTGAEPGESAPALSNALNLTAD